MVDVTRVRYGELGCTLAETRVLLKWARNWPEGGVEGGLGAYCNYMCLRQALLSRRPRTKVRAINRAMFGGHVYIGEIRYAGNWGGGGQLRREEHIRDSVR